MSQISLGEDVLGILIAVIIISTFVIVLGNSQARQRKYKRGMEKIDDILYLSNLINYEAIKNDKYTSKPGIIQKKYLMDIKKDSEIFDYFKNRTRVEIYPIEENKPLISIGKDSKVDAQSLSLPITFESETGKIPARMIIQMD